MSGISSSTTSIDWYDGPRGAIRELFELADDSPMAIDEYIEQGRVLVARTPDGAIIGHLQLLPTADPAVAEIKSLAVQEEARGHGVGRRLLEHAVSVCRDEHARAVTLVTALADVDVLRFYQRCGFRAASIEPDLFTPEHGYPANLEADGIPVRDAIRFVRMLTTGDSG